jgi:hypothetical protein
MKKKGSETGDLMKWLEGEEPGQSQAPEQVEGGESPTPEQPGAGGPPGQDVADNEIDIFLQGGEVPPPAPRAAPSPSPASPPEAGREAKPAEPQASPQAQPPREAPAAPVKPASPEAAPPGKEMSVPLETGVIAHFLLIDIDGPVKLTRGLPRYLPLTRSRTLAGRYVSAHLHLDDERTVLPKHAKILYEERGGQRLFVVYPLDEARVLVNGRVVTVAGTTLSNGDVVHMGSAKLVFFEKHLKDAGA